MVNGTYTFRYTITGGCSPGSVDVTVTVLGTSALTSPSAGPDQYFCSIPGTISLTGNNGAVGETVAWSQIGGGTTTTIANTSNANTSVSGLTDAGAPYAFKYSITNGGCGATDTVNIYKIPNLSLTSTPISICNGGYSSQRQGPTFGNYTFNSLDMVNINITYLSGPAGASPGATIGQYIQNIGGTDLSVIPTGSLSTIGQTISWKVFGNNLYFNSPYSTPSTSLYYLANQFYLNTPGTYRFRVTYSTKCGTYETEITAYSGLIGTGVNAGTDLLLGLRCNFV
ncbi:MAG: hypothetical protein WDM90_07445 [Ferruginibacter sp.]